MNNKGKPSSTIDQEMVLQMMQSFATYVRTSCVSLASKSNFRYRISIETIRPLSEFLGVQQQQQGKAAAAAVLSGGGAGSTHHGLCSPDAAFTSPIPLRTPIDYKQVLFDLWARMKGNSYYYRSNYAVITFGVALIVALLNPIMILYLCILWILWTFHTFLLRHDLVIFGINLASVMTITNRKRTLFLLSCLVVAFKCYKYAKTVLALSTVIIIAHILFRNDTTATTQDNNNEATITESSSASHNNNMVPTGGTFEDEGFTVTSLAPSTSALASNKPQKEFV